MRGFRPKTGRSLLGGQNGFATLPKSLLRKRLPVFDRELIGVRPLHLGHNTGRLPCALPRPLARISEHRRDESLVAGVKPRPSTRPSIPTRSPSTQPFMTAISYATPKVAITLGPQIAA